MADSESSTSRPAVTRNPALLSAVTAALRQKIPDRRSEMATTIDSAISRWKAWSAAHARTTELCRKQQRLETQLFQMAKPAPIANAANSCTRWDDADKAVGYSAAKREEEQAAAEEQKLAAALWAAPAESTLGVCAKLAAIIEHGQWTQDCPEFPWPQLRSALADLFQIGQSTEFPRPAVENGNSIDQSARPERT
jgi:hypothetical protein